MRLDDREKALRVVTDVLIQTDSDDWRAVRSSAYQLGDIESEWSPTAEMFAESCVIPPDFAMCRRGAKMQPERSSWAQLDRANRLAIPADAVPVVAFVVLKNGGNCHGFPSVFRRSVAAKLPSSVQTRFQASRRRIVGSDGVGRGEQDSKRENRQTRHRGRSSNSCGPVDRR